MLSVDAQKKQLWSELSNKHSKEKPILELWYKHFEVWAKSCFWYCPLHPCACLMTVANTSSTSSVGYNIGKQRPPPSHSVL